MCSLSHFILSGNPVGFSDLTIVIDNQLSCCQLCVCVCMCVCVCVCVCVVCVCVVYVHMEKQGLELSSETCPAPPPLRVSC